VIAQPVRGHSNRRPVHPEPQERDPRPAGSCPPRQAGPSWRPALATSARFVNGGSAPPSASTGPPAPGRRSSLTRPPARRVLWPKVDPTARFFPADFPLSERRVSRYFPPRLLFAPPPWSPRRSFPFPVNAPAAHKTRPVTMYSCSWPVRHQAAGSLARASAPALPARPAEGSFKNPDTRRPPGRPDDRRLMTASRSPR